jgi:hypothetical protein
MKKLLLLGSLLSFSFLSTAQNQPQVPNGDFEEWESFTPCAGIDSLINFYTSEVDYYYFTKDRDGTGSCLSYTITIKSTDKYSGTYSLKLLPTPIIGFPNKYTGGSVLISKYIDLAKNPSGVPFTGKPTKLIGYYKFNKAGTDTMGIMVSTSVINPTEPILYGEFSTITSQTSFTKFEIILEDFDISNQSVAAVLNLSIGFSNSQGYADANTYLIVDNLSFEYTTTTSTTNYTSTSTSAINIYAENKNINFSDNVSNVHIVDMTGVNALQETASTKQVNAGNLKSGLYVVTYKYNDNYFSKKIVLE